MKDSPRTAFSSMFFLMLDKLLACVLVSKSFVLPPSLKIFYSTTTRCSAFMLKLCTWFKFKEFKKLKALFYEPGGGNWVVWENF